MRIEKQTVTIEEAAKILGISRTTAYALAKAGELPGAIRLGGSVRVSVSELERVLHPSTCVEE